MENNITTALKNWIPYTFDNQSADDICKWMYLGDKEFHEPFFDSTLRECKALPINQSRYHPTGTLDVLIEWATQIEVIQPTAFIFHISRCGSTLVSQLLGLLKTNLILSEVPFIDDLLRYNFKNNHSSLKFVKSGIDFYCAKRTPYLENVFIKCDSWHIHFYEELRLLYPTTPFFLLYHKPDRVIQSHQKIRGMHAVPGLIDLEIFNLKQEEIFGISQDEYLAKVIEGYLAAYIRIVKKDEMALLLNFSSGPLEILNKICSVTGIQIDDTDFLKINNRINFHSKHPQQVFKAVDEENKSAERLENYLNLSYKLFDELEVVRKESL